MTEHPVMEPQEVTLERGRGPSPPARRAPPGTASTSAAARRLVRDTLLVVLGAIATARAAAALPAGDVRVGASNTIQVIAALSASVVAIGRSRRTAGRTRLHLRLVGAGAGAWAIGQLYWTVAQAVLHVDLPFPAPSDVAFLALIPLMLAAVTLAPSSRFHDVGISPSGGRVVMTLAGTAVPTRGARRRRGCCEASSCCTS